METVTAMETVTLRPKPDRRRRPRFPPAAIARCAYELYQRRGGEPGHDMDDWLRAERELLLLLAQGND
jgi:hypothetical protein